MSSDFPLVPLGNCMLPIERPEVPITGKIYRQIGVRLWGEGAYEREPIDGSQTKYSTLSCVEADDIIVNKIWARNGSVAVVPEYLAGSYGSGEFPTFTPIRKKMNPRWFHWFTKTRDFWKQCDEKSRGTSGKNRIRPEKFLEISIPLPSLEEQHRIVARIEELAARIEEARGLRREAAAEAEKVVVTVRAKIFQEKLKGEVTSLNNIAILDRGKFSHRPRNDPRFFGGDHPWIQIAEIEASGKHIQKWTQTLNDEGLKISRKFPKGTLLISIAATIGTPSRFLCNGVKREGVKASPDRASGFSTMCRSTTIGMASLLGLLESSILIAVFPIVLLLQLLNKELIMNTCIITLATSVAISRMLLHKVLKKILI